MARFLFLNQHYAPDVASTGQHLTDLAEELVVAGHEVDVVASRAAYEGGRLDAPRRETRNGVRVRRVGATSFGRGSTLGRLVDYASFHTLVGLRTLLRRRRPDVVVTLTTPPLLGVWGELARRLRRVRHVPFLMDLHPDAEIALGMLERESFLGRVLRAGQRVPVSRSTRAVVLGPYMAARLVSDGVPAERLVTIPIWSDGDELARPAGAAELRARHGWTDAFVVMYSGNAGRVHRFDEFLRAAAVLAERAPEVRFAFVGGGPRRAALERRVAREGLGNVEFHGYVPREELAASLAAADVHLASLEPAAAGVSVPGKLVGILAAARPVVFVGPRASESFETVVESGAGVAVEPDGDVVEPLLRLRGDAALRARMGRDGRAWFERHHSRRVACGAWRELLEEVAAGRADGGSA